MHIWRLFVYVLVFGFATWADAEVVYSGVKSVSISAPHSEVPLDLDGDGTADLGFTYGLLQTLDIPPSVTSGQVYLRPKGAHRVLVTGNDVAALPQTYLIDAQATNGFTWAGAADRPYGVNAGTWGQTRNMPWTGWQRFAAAPDPVFGVELHSTAGIRYGWVRLRFSHSGFYAGAVYDWAYETTPGQPLIARVGSNGVLTPAPPAPPAPPAEDTRRGTPFVARLTGSKAVPPNSNPLTGDAHMSLTGGALPITGGTLSLGISVNSEGASATNAIVQGRGEEQTIALTMMFIAIHEPGSTDGSPTDPGSTTFVGSAAISPTLAEAIRDGEAHLLLTSASGALRGQIAQPLPEPPTPEPQPLAGTYALLLRPEEGSTEGDAQRAPAGISHGQLHLAADRSAVLDVTLPLGSPLRWRGTLAADGALIIDAPLGKAQGGGSVKGTLTVTSSGTAYLVNGTLDWRRPPGAERARYPAGFKVTLAVEGERQADTRPRSNSYLLSLAGGPLPDPISVTLNTPHFQFLSAAVGEGRSTRLSMEWARETLLPVFGPNPHEVKIDLDRSTGFFRGSFRHPGTRSLVPFAGRMLFGLNRGAGAFTSLRKSGAVSITPIAKSPLPGGLVAHTLTPSATDPDVVMLSASAMVPDTSYDLELVARPVSTIPADGIYDFDLVRRKVADIGLTVITNRTATIALQRNASFQGMRVYSLWASLSNITITLPTE
ncbi:MAG TPA: hypothetical protein VF614_17225 [Chthoniobacteraceae bacterium]